VIPPAPQHTPKLSVSAEFHRGSRPAPVHTPKLSTSVEELSNCHSLTAAPPYTPKLSTSPMLGESFSLFHTLGFPEMAGIDAIAEGQGSDSESEQSDRRVPLCAEPLALVESDQSEVEAWTPFPLMTPSPQYHAATYMRHASVGNVQRSSAASPLTRHLHNRAGSQPAQLGGVAMAPCSMSSPQYPGLRRGQLPRLAEASV